MAWDDFIKSFEYDPASFDYAKFRERIEKEHADDVSVREAKIRTLSEENGSLTGEVTRVKSKLFDLTMQQPGSEQPPGGTDQPPADDPPAKTVDDLFKRE